jgi:WXG100 family type VII secretion target
MAGLIRVTPKQLAGVSSQLTAGAGNIEATLSQLASNVAPLGSDWAGMGQARFLSLWQQWQTSSRQLHQALTDISVLMRQASVAYSDNDAQVGASFN